MIDEFMEDPDHADLAVLVLVLCLGLAHIFLALKIDAYTLPFKHSIFLLFIKMEKMYSGGVITFQISQTRLDFLGIKIFFSFPTLFLLFVFS